MSERWKDHGFIVSDSDATPPNPGASVVLIDTPSPFAPVEDWRGYLAELQHLQLETPHSDVAEAITEAEAHLAQRDEI